MPQLGYSHQVNTVSANTSKRFLSFSHCNYVIFTKVEWILICQVVYYSFPLPPEVHSGLKWMY